MSVHMKVASSMKKAFFDEKKQQYNMVGLISFLENCLEIAPVDALADSLAESHL